MNTPSAAGQSRSMHYGGQLLRQVSTWASYCGIVRPILEPEQQVTSLDIGILVFKGCAFLLVLVPNRTRNVNELDVLLLRMLYSQISLVHSAKTQNVRCAGCWYFCS